MSLSQSSSSSGVGQTMVSQRIVYVDTYTTMPISEVDVLYAPFRGTEVKRVPVIRIYGATTKGQKACAHIHGVFPYLYIEHDSKIFNMEQRLAAELDRGINTILSEFNWSKESEHVYKIVQVCGRSFYGYKSQSQTFLKIFFYSPIALSKASGLLQSGKIIGRVFQPFESHIPYILQFFMDFNLHGMNLIHYSNVKFRGRIENFDEIENLGCEHRHQVWDLSKLSADYFLPAKVLKKTHSELEFDVAASDIIFSHASTGRNPGIEAIWLDERERRKQHGLVDWAEVPIPVSQARPFDSYVFKREEELILILQAQIQPYLDSFDDSQEVFLSTPPTLSTSWRKDEADSLIPSGQVLIEDFEIINTESQQSQSLEWDETDEEMVALLDEMGKNRVLEDEDSIISSQILADFQNDPYLTISDETVGNGSSEINEEVASSTQVDEEEEDDEEWGQDFLSTSFCAFLDECESRATGNSSKLSSFVINQSDGQFDSSSEDDQSDFQNKSGNSKRRNEPRTKIPRISKVVRTNTMKPVMKSLVMKPIVSISPVIVSPNRSRIRPLTPPSPEILEGSSTSEQDSDETNFSPSQSLTENQMEETKESAMNQMCIESSREGQFNEDLETQIEDVDEDDNLGIQSFYKYPGDPSQIIDPDTDTDEEEKKTKNSPISQSTSIQSFYEYSDQDDCGNSSEDEVMDTSFEEVVLGQHSDSFGSSSSDDDENQESIKSNFMRQAERSKLKLKQERECYKATKESFCPSLFTYELSPLKNPPSKTDCDKWIKQKRRHSNEDEEPPSLKYFRQNRKSSEDRNKMVQEILTMRAEIIEKLSDPSLPVESRIPELIPESRIPANSSVATTLINQKKLSSLQIAFSESDSDEDSKPSKTFRFGGGGNSDGNESLSSDDISDTDTLIGSPTPTPSPVSSGIGLLTPILRRSIQNRRRLDLKYKNGSQEVGISLDESELDSISFKSSQSSGEGPNLNSSNFQDVKALHECQFLTTMSMEVNCGVRGSLIPDPVEDPIKAIFYFLHTDIPQKEKNMSQLKKNFGYMMVGRAEDNMGLDEIHQNSIQIFTDELCMIKKFIQLVHTSDPDILVGYEICKFSWGYLIERGNKLGLEMTTELSRLLPLPKFGKILKKEEEWNESISGRIVFNLWKLLRHEITVTSYTFESAVFQILHERVHLLSFRILAEYWDTMTKRSKVISYYERRVVDVIRIIEKLDLINRTSELARLFGIQFFEVLSRGSQFRVESMMLRLAKGKDFIPPSPNPIQRAHMKAPEYLPLILEPESKFYVDPVSVLDFQSLYPSMMMAYNYCFSTCIGRVQHLGQKDSFEFGCLNQEISPEELCSLFLKGQIHISPCGVVFVKESVKKGILGEMMEEILDTRQMVKRSMKKWKDDETLQKVLDSRQLGLKLIANVTYGYTSANYSGRMPCVEIADSVVSKGRETLQRAIDFVKENEERFHAKVVYGDTDSLFLHFPEKTRAEAFKISQLIVDEITAMNPKPVKLKLEKVYQPCILQTKKRYVGHSYESADQLYPKYDAKGIETVRRDGCPATAKILGGALKVLFVTQNEAKVKEYVLEQFRKIFMGHVSLSKYTFAREYRGRSGYRPKAVVPSLEIAKRLVEKDPRAEPLRRTRVPYIVVYGKPNVPLIQLIRRPDEFIGNPNLRLNAHYYVEKAIIPALNRCFILGKMDVSKWYSEMPRKYLKSHYIGGGGAKKGTIDQYFVSETCIKCESRTSIGFCENCFSNAEEVGDFLTKEINEITQKFSNCANICTDCSKEEDMICVNMDCPIKHRFLRYDRDQKTRLPKLMSLSEKLSIAMSNW